MPILPIDTGRYGTPEMKRIFEEETRIQKMLNVEAALAWAHAEIGNIPREAAEKISSMASTEFVRLDRMKEIEKEIKHDLAALVRALAEVCGSSGAYVHFGATSYDIVDTAWALQIEEALGLVEKRLNELEKTLMTRSSQHVETLMMGRTHGQHALPITLGFKFAVWMREVSRHIQRIKECRPRIIAGKMSGAVGVQAGFGPQAMKIQKLVMKRLGINAADVSTQIVQRDRHGELICLLALIGSTLENFATEVRQLQRPEIGELFESFDAEKRVGSSTMPHKRDPETCETVCGLSRILRSLVIPALENVVTWHERDMTQSSAERFIIPEAFILVDHMLLSMFNVITNLMIDEKRMLKNMELTRGHSMSEAVMIRLTQKGMSRQEAHELLRKLSTRHEEKDRSFREILIQDQSVSQMLSESEIDEALDPKNYVGTALEQVELLIAKTTEERKKRGAD